MSMLRWRCKKIGQHKAAARVYEALCGIVAKYHSLLERKAYPIEAANILPPRFTTDGARVAVNGVINNTMPSVCCCLDWADCIKQTSRYLVMP